jgi:aminoacrylate hydrolase
MPQADVNGVTLHYERIGTGPDVVLLSGHGNTHRAWDLQLPVYARRFTCLTLDNRGVGNSTMAPRGYSIDDMACDTLALMDALGIRVAHVAGTSMGGSIAIAMALQAPDRVRSLSLHSTLGRAYPHVRLRYSMLVRATLADDARLWAEVTAFSAFSEAYVNGHPREVEQEIGRRTQKRAAMGADEVEGIIGQYIAFSTYDPFDALPAISAPTLVTVGSEDAITPPRYARELSGRIRGSELHVFPDAPHRTAVFAAEAFNRISLDFLERQEAAVALQPSAH